MSCASSDIGCAICQSALTPHLDLVVITSRHEKGASRVDSDGPHRSYDSLMPSRESGRWLITHLHAPQTCPPIPPCDNSRAARFHCAGTLPVTAESDETRVLVDNKHTGPCFGGAAASECAPLTRLLLDSNFVSITDIVDANEASLGPVCLGWAVCQLQVSRANSEGVKT